MHATSLSTIVLLSTLIAIVPARAAECVIERDALDDTLSKAPSCAVSYRLFEDCSGGASGDVSLGTIVQERCEADFLKKLDGPKKAAYQKQLAACDRKYAKQSGSMYRSFEAFCRAGAARDHAKKYSK
jgi:hypothetical protein